MEASTNKNTYDLKPEFKELLKHNYFFVNKAKFPSFFASSVLLSYFFVGIAIFVVLYFEHVIWTYLFSALLITIAFFYTFKWFKPYFLQKRKYLQRPTHNQIENWFASDILSTVKPAAIEMLSLNPATITPDNFIIVPYPVFWKYGEIEDSHITRVNTGEYNIYSTQNVQVLALTENYISFYHCTFDWLNNAIVNPKTLEFFFDDISSIRVENQELGHRRIDASEAKKGEDADPEEYAGVGPAQTIVIKNKSGETIDVAVAFSELNSSPRISLKPEKIMQTLRIMLRHRRYGEEFEIIRPPEEETI